MRSATESRTTAASESTLGRGGDATRALRGGARNSRVGSPVTPRDSVTPPRPQAAAPAPAKRSTTTATSTLRPPRDGCGRGALDLRRRRGGGATARRGVLRRGAVARGGG